VHQLPGSNRNRPHRDDRPFRSSRLYAFLAAATALVVIVALGEMTLRAYSADRDSERRLDAVSRAALLRAKVESELNSLLYLSSGLGSYLMVRRDTLRSNEVTDILAVLHRSSRHVRNFGIAIGYRLTYVYPLKGNEQAVGLYYPDQPAQWPLISRIIVSGRAALAGPIDLVQGGHGIVYRAPLFVDGKYWGLLSTVIDADSFFEAIADELPDGRYRFALRGKDGGGMRGEGVWGDVALFDRPDAVVQEIDVPGGRWAIAVTAYPDEYPRDTDYFIRLLSGILGGLIAWMLYALIRSRSELARRAMYDDLTGLPNRILFEDRAEMAFARQHRAKAAVRSNDTVARWGGDEFIVLLENVTPDMIAALMARLRNGLQAPIEFEGRRLAVGISMGMAIHPETGGDLDETLRAADQRMYEDKLSRRTMAG